MLISRLIPLFGGPGKIGLHSLHFQKTNFFQHCVLNDLF